MASLPTYDININQNATFKFSAQLTDVSGSPLNITSWSFSGSIKQQATDPDPPILFFTTSIADITQSIINVSLTPHQTALLTQPQYVYDIIAANGAVTPEEVYRILQGRVKVSLGITDPPTLAP